MSRAPRPARDTVSAQVTRIQQIGDEIKAAQRTVSTLAAERRLLIRSVISRTGASYDEVGAVLGVSGSRVGQLVGGRRPPPEGLGWPVTGGLHG